MALSKIINSGIGAIDTLTVDRATSDGTIIDLQKNGSTVGSIGVASGDRLYIAAPDSSPTGLVIDGDNARINPSNGTGADRDAAVNLGHSGARFANLYLSGGVYLGGTGSANLLDDYEEGTWTPTTSSGSWTVSEANYVKVGSMVFCRARVSATATISPVDFDGLPFTVSGSYSSGSVGYQSSVSGETWNVLVQNTTLFSFRNGSSQKGLSNGSSAMFAFTYITSQ